MPTPIRIALFWCCAVAAAGQTDTDLLTRIRQNMARNLSQVPNYTCVQTLERSVRSSAKQKFHVLDKLRLEIALVEGKELYSWPGAGQFEDRDIGSFVPGGTTTRGDYALHARSVFISSAPKFKFAGDEDLGGRHVVRFDYDVSLAATDYLARYGGKQAKIPYHGTFWADRDSLELVRLDVIADRIPRELEMAGAATEIRYGIVRVGQSDFLLPRQVDLTLRTIDGGERRNQTTFANCHQYVGESQILFDDPSPVAATNPADRQIELPKGLSLDMRLAERIDFDKAAIGDPVSATLLGAVKKDGKVLIPGKAVIHGRIRQLQNTQSYRAVAIEMFEAQFGDTHASFFSKLDQAGPVQGESIRSLAVIRGGDEKGMGTLVLQSSAKISSLPVGLRMVWITLPKTQ